MRAVKEADLILVSYLMDELLAVADNRELRDCLRGYK